MELLYLEKDKDLNSPTKLYNRMLFLRLSKAQEWIMRDADLIGRSKLWVADHSPFKSHTTANNCAPHFDRGRCGGGQLGTEKLYFHLQVGFQDQNLSTAFRLASLAEWDLHKK